MNLTFTNIENKNETKLKLLSHFVYLKHRQRRYVNNKWQKIVQ